jgi:predicted Zn-dependent protease
MSKALIALALLACAGTASAQDFFNMLKKVLPQTQSAPATLQDAAPLAQAVGGLLGKDSMEEEIAVGRQLAGDLLGAVKLLRDDRLQAYVNKVGRWVASQTERADLAWYFGVLDSSDINAFALPGGYVFITRGLYARLGSEAELAGALGHEIGHIIMQHHIKVLKQSRMVGAASSLLGREIGGNSIGNAAAQNLLGNGAEAVARGLDKDAEFEADRIGVVLATRAGYSPFGLPAVLQKISRTSAGDSSVALLFKTHPSPQDRLSRLGDAMGDSFDRYADGKALPQRLAAIAGQGAVTASPAAALPAAPGTPLPEATASAGAQSPEAFCADRTNFISRNLCLRRECDRPEKKDLPFCVNLRGQ